MSLVVTPGYTWVNGEVETATKLNLAATPTIADGQAAVFSTLSTTGTASLANIGGAYVSIQTGGFIAAGSNLANDNLVLQGKGTGSVLIGYNGGSGGAQFFAGDTTQRAAITATGLAVTGALSATTSVSSATLNVTGELTFGGAIFRTTSAFNNSNSTTLTAIPGLSVNITNAGVYAFSVNLYVDNGDGFKVDFSGTSTVSAFVAGTTILAEATAVRYTILTAYAASQSFAAGGYTSSQVTITGSLVCSGTGTFTPRFAQATGGGASSVHIGSNMSIRRIS